MKNIITFTICFLALTSSFASTYTNNAFSKADDKDKIEITLSLNDVKAGQKLSIKDEDGVLLFNTTLVKSGNFNNKFDITNLPNGNYHFELEKDVYTSHIPFTVSSGEAKFDTKNETKVYKPFVSLKDNNIYFSKLELNKDSVEFNIYYLEANTGDYTLLHTEKISDTIKIERAYRLSENKKGEYKIVINANGQSYVEHFKI
ncbi:hypothetical protein ACJOV8_005780 [Formosa sp. 3Alg 14/1]|uniref:hypothetical protein n=1 Tax=Formosa sp. 3Alg 14/1 TaxID=3382190 RepID=UPI0039BE6D1B